ncbi:unnamed protein product [Closterium sp. NIES-54]
MSQSLELNQRHHVMHLLPEVDCGPKAWTVLKELHAPTSVVATLMLERELSALRLSEGEPVQPVLDKMRDLYAKLATAEITYPEQTKCLKMLSLLPESWLQFTSGLSLPQNQSLWTLEWVRTKILEEDFRRRQLKLNGQPPDDNCEICLLSKFTRFPFHSVTGRSKKPLELVHMDLVGPLPVQGHKGERYFLTIVDDWSRLMWAYPLKQKDHADSTIKEDWLPLLEKQA